MGLLLFCAAPLLAQTRVYFPIDTAADVSPTPGGWTYTDEVVYRQLEITNTNTGTLAEGQVVDFDASNANDTEVDRIYVSNPLAGGIEFTSGVTTVKRYVFGRQPSSADDVRGCVTRITIVSNDGTSVSATLLALAQDAGTGEFIATAMAGAGRNKECPSSTTVEATHTTSEGERLVIEIGGQIDADGGTSAQYAIQYGGSASDCAEDNSSTTACNPWMEFSNNITEQGTGTGKPARLLPLLFNLFYLFSGLVRGWA